MSDDAHIESAEAVARLFLHDASCVLMPSEHGMINRTYFVAENANTEPSYVLQRMHSLFAPTLMSDIVAITSHLDEQGFPAPRMLSAMDGKKYIEMQGAWWRMMTYLPGVTHSHIQSPAMAASAGALIGRFHTAMQNFLHPLKHALPHFHATEHILSRLETVAESHKAEKKYAEIYPLIENIREHAEGLVDDAFLPRRFIHGDLKISNIRFDTAGRAQSVLDFDTCMYHTIMVEMGDALRSWCMDGDEDTLLPTFNGDRCAAALEEYFEEAKFLEPRERQSILAGIERITVELAARFVIDAFEESYFTHDSERYESRYLQNKQRAKNQLALLYDFSRKRANLERFCNPARQ